MATYYLECEFVTGSYTNITADCIGAEVSQQLALFRTPITPHAASFTIVNDNAKYSPRNSLSALYPNVIVGKNIRLGCYSTTSEYLFNGKITRITADPQIGNQNVSLVCESNVSEILDKKISLVMSEGEAISSFFTRVCSAIGIVNTSDNIQDKTLVTYAYNDDAQEVLNKIMDNGYHFIKQLTTGGLYLMGRSQKLNDSTITGSYQEFYSLNYEFAKTDVINNVVLHSNRRELTIQSSAAVLLPGAISLASGGNSFTVNHIDYVTNEQDCPFKDIILLAAQYRNTSTTSGGQDYTSSCSTYLTSYGKTTVVSIYNGASTNLYITEFTLSGRPYRKVNDTYKTSQDNSSQALYGTKTIAQDNTLLIDEAFTNNYPQFILWQKQDNVDSVSFSLKNIYPDIIQKTTGDLIYLTNSFLGLNGSYIITQIDHSISLLSDIEHTAMYRCQKWQTNNWFNLDADHLDIDRLGF